MTVKVLSPGSIFAIVSAVDCSGANRIKSQGNTLKNIILTDDIQLPGDRHRDSSPPECLTTPFHPRKAVASELKNVRFPRQIFINNTIHSLWYNPLLLQAGSPNGLVYLQVHGGTFSLFLRCKRRKFFKYTAVISATISTTAGGWPREPHGNGPPSRSCGRPGGASSHPAPARSPLRRGGEGRRELQSRKKGRFASEMIQEKEHNSAVFSHN